MGALDRIFGRNRRSAEGDPSRGFTGLVRVGTSVYSARWNFARVLNNVYANPTGYACVQMIKNDFKRPNYQVTDLNDPDEVVDNTSSAELLQLMNQPDKSMSGTMMLEHIAMDLELNGRSLWLKLRGKTFWGDKGPLTGFKRIPCENITVVTNFERDLLGFWFTTDNGVRIPLAPSEVLYLHYAHPQDRWQGFPPAYIAGLPAEIDEAAKRFNWKLLENDGAFPGYLAVEGVTPQQFQEAKYLWESQADPGRTRYIGAGKASYVKVGASNQDLMYDALRDYAQDDIAKAFGMSILVLNPTDATFSNGDQARVNYMKTKMAAMWAMVSDEMTVQLQDDFPDLRIGFDLSTIEELQEGLDSLYERAVLAYEAGLLSDDESRDTIGFGPKSEAPGEFLAPKALENPKGTPNDKNQASGDNFDPQANEGVNDRNDPADIAGGGSAASTGANTAVAMADMLELTTKADSDEKTGICVAFWLTPSQANEMAVSGGEASTQLHVTLAFCGNTTDGTIDYDAISRVLATFAAEHGRIDGSISGKGIFEAPDNDVVVGLVDAPGLPEFRQDLVEALETAGIPVSHDHGYTPHITVAYVESGGNADVSAGTDLLWDTITLAWGSSHTDFPLTGTTKSASTLTTKAEEPPKSEADAARQKEYEKKLGVYQAQATRKMTRYYAKQGRVISAGIRSKRGKSFQKAIDTAYDANRWNAELKDDAKDMYNDVIDAFGVWQILQLTNDVTFDPTTEEVTTWISTRSETATAYVSATTQKDLAELLAPYQSGGELDNASVDDVADAVDSYFNGSSTIDMRAMAWGMTEAAMAAGFATLAAAYQSNAVDGKYWVVDGNPCEICLGNLDDGTIPLDASFSSGDEAPGIHVNCACDLGYEQLNGNDSGGGK